MNYIIISMVILVLDLTTKYLAVANISHDSYAVIEGVFHFTYVENSGIAFGALQGHPRLFAILSFIIMLGMVYYVYRTKPKDIWIKTACAFILGGAAGNMIDRFYRGFVVDFIDFRIINFWVFNIADIFIVTGAGLLLLRIYLKDKQTKV